MLSLSNQAICYHQERYYHQRPSSLKKLFLNEEEEKPKGQNQSYLIPYFGKNCETLQGEAIQENSRLVRIKILPKHS